MAGECTSYNPVLQSLLSLVITTVEQLREVYSTQCGHSFCFQCISAALQRSQKCPVCKAAVQGRSALHPYCSLNDVVAKFRSQTAKNRELAKCSHPVADILTLAADLSSQELCRVLQSIAERGRM